MAFLSRAERAFARTIRDLAYCNPFLPERIEYEKQALGDEFAEVDTVWSKRTGPSAGDSENVQKIVDRVEKLAETLRGRLERGAKPHSEDQALYEDLVFFLLFHRYHVEFRKVILRSLDEKAPRRQVGFYDSFLRDHEQLLGVNGLPPTTGRETAHLFACFFQVRRAFNHIFECFIGESLPAARQR